MKITPIFLIINTLLINCALLCADSTATVDGRAVIGEMSAKRNAYPFYSASHQMVCFNDEKSSPADDSIITKKCYEKKIDGIVFKRTEDQRTDRTIIINKTGVWELYRSKKIALNLDLIKTDSSILNTIDVPEKKPLKEPTYIVEETKFKGADCYLVKEIMSPEQNDLTRTMLNTSNSSTHTDAQKNIRISYYYYIRKSDYALLAKEFYDKPGHLLTAIYYSDIDYTTPLPDSLFEIPENYKTYKPAGKDEKLQIIHQLNLFNVEIRP